MVYDRIRLYISFRRVGLEMRKIPLNLCVIREEMSDDCILSDAFSVRGDESVIIAVYHIDTGTSEFKRIEFDADWSVSETTIGKIPCMDCCFLTKDIFCATMRRKQ